MPLTSRDELLGFLRTQGEEWIRTQQRVLRVSGRCLAPPEVGRFSQYFGADTLECARIVEVRVIENPDFYAVLAGIGVSAPIDFTQMSGITFVDTIVLAQARLVQTVDLIPLLFHELVHVAQYQRLGVEEFVCRYVGGWADNGFQYDKIPLERQAYELQARFGQARLAFNVNAEVARRFM